ncbi:MAG: cytochrome c maturation protein CcmE [Anaerolineae bacterium]|jgi:cytochrome c-type biogenesis protein CcmE|nr:cytochrome c maturation protein CcmE [Anaerolineae bacterium]MBT7074335.1 cytochrome c maturation protein CcmE [Anaerolineae bacterium]MBT7781489.1 cytochrome c maturation protein CcmE [Anaerolineae bacterium]
MKNSKFLIGGLLIVAAVVYLIVSSTTASAEYFMTIEEVVTQQDEILGKSLRISGAVLGDSISYDEETLTISFTVAHVTGDNDEIESSGGLAKVLHDAVREEDTPRLNILYMGPMPDLLQHEAQAIMTGHIEADGIFYADELLLKCPTKYEEAVPDQSETE